MNCSYPQKPLIGVKGRIRTRTIQNDDGSKKRRTEIVAEKVTFLAQSPKSKEEKKDEEKTTKEKSKPKKDKKADE